VLADGAFVVVHPSMALALETRAAEIGDRVEERIGDAEWFATRPSAKYRIRRWRPSDELDANTRAERADLKRCLTIVFPAGKKVRVHRRDDAGFEVDPLAAALPIADAIVAGGAA
jgi:hypothetical protein